MNLERIEITPFAVIVGDILQERRTGHLTLLHASMRRTLYWSQGELVLITSTDLNESIAAFLVRAGVITVETAQEISPGDPIGAVARVHEAGILELSRRQILLRQWMTSLFVPMFAMEEGTVAFHDSDAIDPDKRVFLQSTGALVLEGVRGITNGLVLRRSLGDLKREIEPERDGRYSFDSIPLTDPERRIAESLDKPETIESLLKRFTHESGLAARVAIGMLALGLYKVVEHRSHEVTENNDDMQRDLEMLAAIGSSDPRSLRAVALSRQLNGIDHYQLLDLPRAASKAQILSSTELMRNRYDPATFPAIVRDAVTKIVHRIDEAASVLRDPIRRQEYDRVMGQRTGGKQTEELQKRVARRTIAEQNYNRARDLMIQEDYYGAIVLLKQAVNYAPEHGPAWFHLGTCQERNPKWRREAAESFQRALSIDPNNINALISLGDLYRSEGLTSRAQTCWEDAVKIAPDNQQANSRLASLRKK